MAYVDLKAAFDSVDRNALWDLLTNLGIPPKIRSMFVAAVLESTVTTQSGSQS